jgi:hypothetical protein
VNEVGWDAGILSAILAKSGLAVVIGATVGHSEVILAHELIIRDRAARAGHATPRGGEEAGWSDVSGRAVSSTPGVPVHELRAHGGSGRRARGDRAGRARAGEASPSRSLRAPSPRQEP